MAANGDGAASFTPRSLPGAASDPFTSNGAASLSGGGTSDGGPRLAVVSAAVRENTKVSFLRLHFRNLRMRYIARELEDTLVRAARSFPAVVLTGPRRAGKTCRNHQDAGPYGTPA